MEKNTDAQRLKELQRRRRENFPPNLSLRVHRAISWVQRAEASQDDPDAAFIFYWIAFNAVYAGDNFVGNSKGDMSDFFGKIIKFDRSNIIYDTIWTKFHGPIRVLLQNKYVFQEFWNHQNKKPGFVDWERRFEGDNNTIRKALQYKNSTKILEKLFARLYVLRNQLVHGGATWNSSANRSQVRDGHRIMEMLVPLFIELIMANPDSDWGGVFYPYIEE
ncbi:MAG: HEPN domain-containing protein [Albidovulum sp.]|nr:HEPN domain-containing protein [Albidovulum sp.]MDE0529984.1 HEPN domain-containing protein [Albidovulum sp.]